MEEAADPIDPLTAALAGPALRDAAAIVAAAEADEQAAIEARREIREEGLPHPLADPDVAAILAPGEALVVARSAVAVERHAADGTADAASGRLIVTTRRLVLLGRRQLEVELALIDELSLGAERLLVTLRDGTGLSIDAGGPRLLRVQIAAAVEAARSAR